MAEVPVQAFVGLGSNLGDREGQIRRAIQILASSPGVSDVQVSSLYETAPVGYLEQPPFLNAAVGFRTTLGPIQLLLLLKQIEQRIGRTPTFRWGPREIDLDLLLYGNQRIERRGLSVPHPAMYERAFVLVPLSEIAPEHRDADGRSLDQILDRLDAAAVRQFSRSTVR